METLTKRTILLVDAGTEDRRDVRRMLQAQRREHRLIEAATGRDGLRLYTEAVDEGIDGEPPAQVDCVLLAFDLPDMDGMTFLDAIGNGDDSSLPVPVVVLASEENDEVAARLLNRGVGDYLVKGGMTASALARAVENTIERCRIQRELVESRIAIELRNKKLEVLRDQLQEKVAELAEATHAKDKFLAVMSHEMRTPLNAIIGYSDLLEMRLDGELEPTQTEHVQRIQLVSRHLLDLINDILDLARADAHRLELDIRPVDAAAVIEEVVAMLEVQAREKGIALRVERIEDGLPSVSADLGRLRQIVTNLIGNAIKFTEAGEIGVRCESDGQRVLIHVSDSGIGIDPDMLGLVFNEFFQVHGEMTREKGGSGLGLAISRRMARLMGGDVEAASEPGKGSTFTVSIPVAEAGGLLRAEDVQRHALRMEGSQVAARTPGGEPVSVVAYGSRSSALAELEQRVASGVRFAWTTNPDDVADLALREQAALVVLDIGDPDSAAWRVAGAIQNLPELAQTAILLLPSIPEVDADPHTGGLDLGWISLVPKPFTAAQLNTAVNAAVRGPGQDGEEPDGGFEVLVVDDDPDSRRVATRFLTEGRMRVRDAQDGESALAEMRRKRPDVVVLDLMMPVLDGFGVLATMRADATLASLPVVVLTAKSLTEAERRFLSRTAVRILQKGEHRLADVASLVLRAAQGARPRQTEKAGG